MSWRGTGLVLLASFVVLQAAVVLEFGTGVPTSVGALFGFGLVAAGAYVYRRKAQDRLPSSIAILLGLGANAVYVVVLTPVLIIGWIIGFGVALSEMSWFGPVLFTGMGVLGTYVYRSSLRAARLYAQTATSSVRGASQGLVELHGRAVPVDEEPVVAPLTAEPCIFWELKLERREGWAEWITVRTEKGGHRALFLVGDGHFCLVEADAVHAPTRQAVLKDREAALKAFGDRLALSEIEFPPRSAIRATETRLPLDTELIALGRFVTAESTRPDTVPGWDTAERRDLWRMAVSTAARRGIIGERHRMSVLLPDPKLGVVEMFVGDRESAQVAAIRRNRKQLVTMCLTALFGWTWLAAWVYVEYGWSVLDIVETLVYPIDALLRWLEYNVF